MGCHSLGNDKYDRTRKNMDITTLREGSLIETRASATPESVFPGSKCGHGPVCIINDRMARNGIEEEAQGRS